MTAPGATRTGPTRGSRGCPFEDNEGGGPAHEAVPWEWPARRSKTPGEIPPGEDGRVLCRN
ncbi:hypothetical protein GCM10010433_26500 [Streptomyces pulveraceus]